MKAALVTGAGRRLGQELAVGLARAGYRVAVHARTGPDATRRTLELVREAGGDGEPFAADLSVPDAPARLAAEVLRRFGRLDVLVHSASVWIEKPVAEVGPADWDRTFAVGPRAGFFLAQGFREALASSGGSILFVSDVAATKAWPRHVPHSTAKAAVDALVRNLAFALAPEVRVNGIAPGIVLPPEELSAAALAALVARTPLRRRVEGKDLVSMAVAILENRSMTGQVVAVDAGRSIV